MDHQSRVLAGKLLSRAGLSKDGTNMMLVFTLQDGGVIELQLPTDSVAQAVVNLAPLIESAAARKAGNPDAMAFLALDVDETDAAPIPASERTMLTLRGEDGLTARFALSPEAVSQLLLSLNPVSQH